MPPRVDAMRLYELALARGITIGPGHMFSVSDSYRHFIRLNYSTPWSPAIERAVITVGKLAADCMR
jgi:DNA-binding transcriptional MocR family regulator